MLIEEVGKKWQELQKVKDAREKGRIWDRIVINIQTSGIASLSLKERTKASIQQKWDALLQKYRDIKDKIESTGEEAIQNDWEFFKDMDNYLRKDPSVVAPITSDSIYGIKHKVQKNAEDQEEVTHYLLIFSNI
jgi:Myb/SANT-like DNA-binding domain